jgi:GntR family transcriptional regulator, transcriptional repressor for pyruvate dehydrogenase complex
MTLPEEERALNKLVEKNTDALYTQIIGRIRMWIIKGYLKEGDTLPSERVLAEMFEVSRMPVSQALKILEFLGVVRHVRGKGVCVKKIDIHHILNNIGFLMLDPQRGLHDLFEAREAIEVKAARLAALRRTKEDLEAMEDALLEMERNIVMKRDVLNASIRFHSALIAASGNDILIKINEFLMEVLRYSRQESLKETSQQDIALGHHKKIFKAIKDQDADQTATAMQEHISGLSAAIQ